jgi:2-hydroxy-3-oxopropionate reductase
MKVEARVPNSHEEFGAPNVTVGFIGLGVMGLPMARNLLVAGYPLSVTARTLQRADAVVSAGASFALGPFELAAVSDVLITMLPDSPDVTEVMMGARGAFAGARRGLVWIDMSSISPLTTTLLVEAARTHGVECLDAPVSGGERAATEGTLSIMVGGTQLAFDKCLPILKHMGSSIVRIGESGSGQIAKICNQVVVGGTIAVVAEALVLAENAGVDVERVRTALLGGFAGSKILEVHGERMLRREFTPGFRMALHQKDLTNALTSARNYGSPLILAAVVDQMMSAVIARGEGDLDHSALVEAYRRLSDSSSA